MVCVRHSPGSVLAQKAPNWRGRRAFVPGIELETRNISLASGASGIRTADTLFRNFPLKCRQNSGLAADQTPNRECRSCELQESAGHLANSSLVVRFLSWDSAARAGPTPAPNGLPDYLLPPADMRGFAERLLRARRKRRSVAPAMGAEWTGIVGTYLVSQIRSASAAQPPKRNFRPREHRRLEAGRLAASRPRCLCRLCAVRVHVFATGGRHGAMRHFLCYPDRQCLNQTSLRRITGVCGCV